MRLLATLGAGVAIVLAGSFVLADQLVLKNGDTLTGSVKESDGKTLTFESKMSGSVKVKLEDIKSLSTDAPVHIKLKDGTKVDEAITPAGEGEAQIGGKATPLTNINSLRVGPAKWSGDVTIGATFTRGNSYTDGISASANAVRRTDLDRTTLGGSYIYSRQKDNDTGVGSVTAENWYLSGKYDYFLTDQLYLFGAAKFERDHIADLDYRVTPSAGLGYQWVERADIAFNTELGLAYVYEKYQHTDPGEDDHRGEISARAAYHLTGKINENLSYFHNLEIYPSIEDVESFNGTTDIGIRATLTKQMFAQFKFQADYDSTPAPGAEKFNLYYILGVGWTF